MAMFTNFDVVNTLSSLYRASDVATDNTRTKQC